MQNSHLLFADIYSKLVYFRNTPALFWNFLIVVFGIAGSLFYYTFPSTSYELSLYFDSIDVFSVFFFYFLIITFATISTIFLGSRGVYILCGWGILSCWWFFFENLRFFFVLGGVKFFKFTTYPSVLNLFNLEVSFLIDKISFAFVFLTLTIGLCATVYSLTYFKNEPHADRFILLLHWFILSMSLLVMSDNAILMFLGWELIGLTSFMLINFWTLRRGTIKAAFKAFTFNKISDIFLLFFIVLMIQETETTSISLWLQLVSSDCLVSSDLQTPVLFLILGCSIKSAQLFGHLWLPDSMEAPIPASALIHSATLVSAGVYLLLKLQLLLFLTSLHYFVFILGACTAFYGAIVSASQTDAKKLLAYSTVSHCGFLFATVAIGCTELTIVYLYLHGFFKALTFFCVGNIIKLSRGYQDTRTMGQFAPLLPIESILFVICAINLGGLPFTVGFFYKHLLQLILISSVFYRIGFIFLFFGMLAGLVYVFRLVYFVLFDFKKGSKIVYHLLTSQYTQYKHYSNTAVFSVLSIFFFLVIAYFIYFFFFYWIVSTGVWQSTVNVESAPTWLVQTFFAISCFIFFCSCFLPIIFVLLLVECRYEFSSLYRKFLIVILLFTIPFFLFQVWGQICTESSYQTNFNFGFSTYKSDILGHLSQWQYWWWFWFSFFWTVYYFLILRTIKTRLVKMNPKMNTSVRGRGKWGDFVVALIPASWCLNILLNSNFILRMIEWQNESSLFTIRIHGKQWYWVYKFDLKNTMDIFTAPKSIGRGRWFVQTPSDLLVTDTYLQAIHLRSKMGWMNEYWGEISKKDLNSFNSVELLSSSPVTATFSISTDSRSEISTQGLDVYNDSSLPKVNNNNKHYEYIDLDNEWDIKHNLKKKTAPGPVRIMKTLYSNLSPRGGDLLRVRFIDTNDSTEAKISSNADYFVLKQKRYKKKQTIKNTTRYEIDPNTSKKTYKNNFLKFYSRRLIRNNKIIEDTSLAKGQDSYSMYKIIRNNRKRSDQLPVTLCRRLLRTKRTLVLPAHTNLTIVTNSYDVVHSWFIPGLGIKLDCVPGRSTHHSFYLDNIGFYYGQCAEICGRYHHHMPIRLCALPFEHFVVWWQTKGLPKLLKLNLKKKSSIEYSSLKYVW